MIRTMAVVAMMAMQATAPAADAVGLWEGALEIGAIKLRLAFKIEKKPDGNLSGTMDSPDQGAKNIPLGGIKVDGDKVTFDLSKFKAEYVGTMSADGKSMAGEWKQAGREMPLTLKRVEKITEVRRPQTPTKPYPYIEEEVVVENAPAGIKLAGTLTKPKEGGPFPAVVLITGSGPQDRDESILGHKPFLVLADHLTRQGIAVLRCDDRGVGKSTGKQDAATSNDFATDAYASLKFLRSRPDIDPKRCGLAGHSEGGLIAPMVAAKYPDEVAFIVLLAGPGVPGDEILVDQLAAIFKAMGATPHEVELRQAMQKKLLAILKAGGKKDELKHKLAEAVKAHLATLSPEDRKLVEKDVKTEDKDYDGMASEWMTTFLTYDPRPTLKQVRCPVLALNGEFDLQVTVPLNTDALSKALAEGGNTKVTVKVLPGLNHLFQHSKTGVPSEYGTIEETVAPEALEAVSRWILELPK